ncbi:hypothetical protein [uncultured Nostoc sp.]
MMSGSEFMGRTCMLSAKMCDRTKGSLIQYNLVTLGSVDTVTECVQS